MAQGKSVSKIGNIPAAVGRAAVDGGSGLDKRVGPQAEPVTPLLGKFSGIASSL